MPILSVYTGRGNKYKHWPWKYQPVEFLPRGNVAVEIKKYPVEIKKGVVEIIR